ncbi:MAG: acetylglutamate kinase [Promethearchaeota archaeon]
MVEKSNKSLIIENLLVLKIGGALIKENLSNLINNIKELMGTYKFVIVHGGGPQIDELYKDLGKTPKIFQTPKGYKTRYSDPEAIDIIKMALGGYVNKTLVELFHKEGINAFGFCAADGKTVVGERKSKIMVLTNEGKRLMLKEEYSGKNFIANPKVIKFLLKNDYVPIIGSLAISKDGELINSDGDRIANAIGLALSCKKIISLTDVNGIYKDLQSKEVIPEIRFSDYEKYMKLLAGGMKKKLYAAIESIKSGIKEIIIGSGLGEKPITSLINGKEGTRIFK